MGETDIVVDAGSLLFKPRDQWHTFWNAGDSEVRVLEIISPGGFEQAFRDLAGLGEPTIDAITEVGARYALTWTSRRQCRW